MEWIIIGMLKCLEIENKCMSIIVITSDDQFWYIMTYNLYCSDDTGH